MACVEDLPRSCFSDDQIATAKARLLYQSTQNFLSLISSLLDSDKLGMTAVEIMTASCPVFMTDGMNERTVLEVTGANKCNLTALMQSEVDYKNCTKQHELFAMGTDYQIVECIQQASQNGREEIRSK